MDWKIDSYISGNVIYLGILKWIILEKAFYVKYLEVLDEI